MDLADFSRFKDLKPIKINRTDWQLEALEFIKKLSDGKFFTGSIMKAYKNDIYTARIAANDTIELEKPYSKYFLKVFTSIIKKRTC